MKYFLKYFLNLDPFMERPAVTLRDGRGIYVQLRAMERSIEWIRQTHGLVKCSVRVLEIATRFLSSMIT
ncbi:MAG: hypothetical protein BWY17_00483 [Deltaproteobacteria bacterium ADurb.Bin207]|jgi:hypothetical protein|nr:MAG: hypothetical protein BWY17_00483 [Deltaproteobacteria bacterium ADurb.Bin207]